ncbi:MAG: TetR/AcrR family transcriptional regulator [Alphaproteobacteria bacterium]|nr:TetR/AcrR family transcriptional regulator [Alphaproteobacteria bacterium]
MTPIAAEKADSTRSVLGRKDWINAALEILAPEGIDAVQITRLGRELDATRGSFYWHFKDRDDLLECIIDHWQAANSGVIAEVLKEAASLTEGVLSLFYLWVNDEQFSSQIDQAIRDWARHNDAIRAVVQHEENSRVEAIAAFFRKHGFTSDDAFVRARVIYFTQVGYYALHIEESMTKRLDLTESYFRTFTGRDIDAGQAKAFRRRLEEGTTI